MQVLVLRGGKGRLRLLLYVGCSSFVGGSDRLVGLFCSRLLLVRIDRPLFCPLLVLVMMVVPEPESDGTYVIVVPVCGSNYSRC